MKQQVANWSTLVQITSSHLEKWNTRGLLRDLHSYLCMVWPRVTKIGMIRQVGKSMFLSVSHVHIPRGVGPSDPQIFGTHTYVHMVWPRATEFGVVCQHPQISRISHTRTHSMRNDNQILHDDQTWSEENSYRSTWRMLTCDLFDVANLLLNTALLHTQCPTGVYYNQCHWQLILAFVFLGLRNF